MAKSKIHWYYGCGWGRACDLHCASASFAKQAAENPDWYCVTCTKAARLALAKEQPVAVSFSATESANWPKPQPSAECAGIRSDSDRYAELRKLVEDCQREAMDSTSPVVVFDNALRLVLDWRHR